MQPSSISHYYSKEPVALIPQKEELLLRAPCKDSGAPARKTDARPPSPGFWRASAAEAARAKSEPNHQEDRTLLLLTDVFV